MAMFVEPSMCKFRSYPPHESYWLQYAKVSFVPPTFARPTLYGYNTTQKNASAESIPSVRVHVPLCLMANSPSFVIVKPSFMMFESLQQALGIHGGSCDKKDMT